MEQYSKNGDYNTRPDGVYGLLPIGKTITVIDSFGIFPPPTKGTPTASGPIKYDLLEWADSFVYFCKALSKEGIVPESGSYGERFIRDMAAATYKRSVIEVERVITKYEDEFEGKIERPTLDNQE